MSCSVTLAMCADAGRDVVDALTVYMPAAPVVGGAAGDAYEMNRGEIGAALDAAETEQ